MENKHFVVGKEHAYQHSYMSFIGRTVMIIDGPFGHSLGDYYLVKDILDNDTINVFESDLLPGSMKNGQAKQLLDKDY